MFTDSVQLTVLADVFVSCIDKDEQILASGEGKRVWYITVNTFRADWLMDWLIDWLIDLMRNYLRWLNFFCLFIYWLNS